MRCVSTRVIPSPKLVMCARASLTDWRDVKMGTRWKANGINGDNERQRGGGGRLVASEPPASWGRGAARHRGPREDGTRGFRCALAGRERRSWIAGSAQARTAVQQTAKRDGVACSRALVKGPTCGRREERGGKHGAERGGCVIVGPAQTQARKGQVRPPDTYLSSTTTRRGTH